MKRKFTRNTGHGNIRIRGGLVIPKLIAKHVCRCADCLGPVKEKNAGLVCAIDPENHRGLIHQDEAKKLQAQLDANQAQAEHDFEIVDGKIKPKFDPIEKWQKEVEHADV